MIEIVKITGRDLKHRIIIEKFSEDKVDGFMKSKWDSYKTVWSSANNLYGKEFWQAKQAGYENVVMFTIRYSKDTKLVNSQEYRINWKGKLFDIIAPPDNVGYANTWLKIKAKEVKI